MISHTPVSSPLRPSATKAGVLEIVNKAARDEEIPVTPPSRRLTVPFIMQTPSPITRLSSSYRHSPKFIMFPTPEKVATVSPDSSILVSTSQGISSNCIGAQSSTPKGSIVGGGGGGYNRLHASFVSFPSACDNRSKLFKSYMISEFNSPFHRRRLEDRFKMHSTSNAVLNSEQQKAYDMLMCEKFLHQSLRTYNHVLETLQKQYTHPYSMTSAVDRTEDVFGYRGLAYYSSIVTIHDLVPSLHPQESFLCAQERLSSGIMAVHRFQLPSVKSRGLQAETPAAVSPMPQQQRDADVEAMEVEHQDSGSISAPCQTVASSPSPEGSNNSSTRRLLRWLHRRKNSRLMWKQIRSIPKANCNDVDMLALHGAMEETLFRDRQWWCLSQPFCMGSSLLHWAVWLSESGVSRNSSVVQIALCTMATRLLRDIGLWLRWLHTYVRISLHGEWALTYYNLQRKYSEKLAAGGDSGIHTVLRSTSGLHPGLVLLRQDEFFQDDILYSTLAAVLADPGGAVRGWRETVYKNLILSNTPHNVNFVVYNLGRARSAQRLDAVREDLFSLACSKDWEALMECVHLVLSFITRSTVSPQCTSYLEMVLAAQPVDSSSLDSLLLRLDALMIG